MFFSASILEVEDILSTIFHCYFTERQLTEGLGACVARVLSFLSSEAAEGKCR